jgi:hypothetical protein
MILDERPAASTDVAGLAAVVEAFITHPAPYEIGDARAVLRGDARTTALASLLGDLTDQIESGAVTPASVAAAIRAAIRVGTDMQRQYLTRRCTDG